MFRFKKFIVNDDACAMKVGTDAVLLGAWSKFDTSQKMILDIGTGCGILSLMLAQRFDWIQIDAIEIDAKASVQCLENFKKSDWNDRLNIVHSSFQDYILKNLQKKYDVCICNPPFFETHQQILEISRNAARNSNFLPIDILISGVSKLLSKKGSFFMIFPFSNFEYVTTIANQNQFYLNKVCFVKGFEKSAIKRCLTAFSFKKTEVIQENLTLQKSQNVFTEEHHQLVKDFYLYL